MKSKFQLLFYVTCIWIKLLICFVEISHAVPPDYCLQTLNTSDCNGKPQRVVYYYKPGSRCAVATWRGCPTANIFPDVFICSHVCIFHMFKPPPEEHIQVPLTMGADDHAEDSCAYPINRHKCSSDTTKVFTFDLDKKLCVETEWYGCPTDNKFNDMATCAEHCHPVMADWKLMLGGLDQNELLQMDVVLDEILNEPQERLKLTADFDKITWKSEETTVTEIPNATESPLQSSSTPAATTTKPPTTTTEESGSAEEVISA